MGKEDQTELEPERKNEYRKNRDSETQVKEIR
jgi:hypothetical protein